MTNTSPLVVATRGKEATFGTNLIAFTASSFNSNSNDDFTLDMATSTVALGKIELENRLRKTFGFIRNISVICFLRLNFINLINH